MEKIGGGIKNTADFIEFLNIEHACFPVVYLHPHPTNININLHQQLKFSALCFFFFIPYCKTIIAECDRNDFELSNTWMHTIVFVMRTETTLRKF